jgi:hypothetical protein
MQIATQHDCGFELIQVRTGTAKSTAYTRDSDTPTQVHGTDDAVRNEVKRVLGLSKGARGVQQRVNVRALGKVMRESIGVGGSGDLALERFGRDIGL